MRTKLIQTSFAGGELSESAHGRMESETYKRALAECRNFMALPLGSLLMRAGTWHVDETATAGRVIPFRASGEADDYIVVLTDGKLRVYSRATGARVDITPNLVGNGRFDAGVQAGTGQYVLGSWRESAIAMETVVDGAYRFAYNGSVFVALTQKVATVAGHTYRVRFRARTINGEHGLEVLVGGVLQHTAATIGYAQTFSFDFVAGGANADMMFKPVTAGYNVNADPGPNTWIPGTEIVELDDVSVTDLAGQVAEINAPWSAAQLEALQHDSEPVQNRMVVVHQAVAPQVISFIAPATWEVYPAPFTSQPVAWGEGNWPGAIEVGFQGRMWLGKTPSEPHTFWGSRPGKSFDFTTGANADDAVSWIVSTKGALHWLRGQHILLAGSEVGEHSISGDGIIAAGNVQVRDESAFGSAPVQGLHIGDQVLFVTRDRRHIRALDYSLERNGWVSQALTFLAGHLTAGLVKELHFALAPHQTLFALTQTGDIAAFTHDRSEKVLAAWRVDLGAQVASAGVASGAAGAELWAHVKRGEGRYCVERLPLHEVDVAYVDAAKSGVVAGDGTFAGLEHLEGETVRVLVDGALEADQDVAAGKVTVDVELAGKSITVGLPYRAKARTLPPAEAVLGAARIAKVGLLLNDSALPLVNGDRAEPDRTPSTPMGTGEPRRSGKTRTAALGWKDGATATIEQDLPFRTEVLAVYGVGAFNEE